MNTRVKTVLATAAFLLAGSLGAATGVRQASADGTSAQVDLSVFYTSLSPYGEWVQVQPYGWVWAPENVDYSWRPYTVGQWSWVEPYGWTWVSEEPWGWATYHYGRWAYVDDYGWVWVPGTAWAPAWVAFRYGDPWVGWAPLPPTTGWRFDSGFDIAGLNTDVSFGTYAWTFVPVRYFAEPDLRSRYVVSSYNPYLVQRTQWSTRYATVDGGVSNRSVDIAAIEKARGKPVPRRRLQEASAPEQGSSASVQGDAVILYRPRVATKAPAQAPPPRARVAGNASAGASLDAWTAQRQAALKAHLEAQRKALEQPDVIPAVDVQPKPAMGGDDDSAKRHEAGLKALEDERKRLEALFERQRKRREQEQQQPQPAPQPPPPPAMDDGHGKKDDGHGMDDDGHGKGMDDDGHGMK